MRLYKKFSFGLSPSEYVSVDELNHFLSLYSKYIRSAYSSPPYPDKSYHTRKILSEGFSREGEVKKFRDKLKLIKKHKLEFKLALNSNSELEDPVGEVKKFTDTMGIAPDRIVCKKKYAHALHSSFPEIRLTYSYTNALCGPKDIEEIPRIFDTVVVGNRWLRDVKFMKLLSDKGFKVEHLLNNGCLWTCSYCDRPKEKHCLFLFPEYLKSMSPEMIYARVSILPDEFHRYIVPCEYIDTYKLSTRPSEYRYLSSLIDSYVNDKTNPESPSDLRLWARLGMLTPYLSRLFRNFETILSYKTDLWVPE